MLPGLVRCADGSISDPRYYTIAVDGLAPIVENPGQASVGRPLTLKFTARLPGSVAFHYWLGSGEEQGVPVGPDGTATVTWIPQSSGWTSLTVQSRSGAGYVSVNGYGSIYVY